MYTGSCSCRSGISGASCDRATKGMFVPSFNYYILEAEKAQGVYKIISEQSESNQNKEFTGFGFASLGTSNSITFKFSPEFTSM